jgi:regulation of enolase protein 1 (concanavalin A-like superfamily)
MKTLTRLLAGLGLLAGLMIPGRAAEAEKLADGWRHQDVGPVELRGGATLAAGVFTVKGTLDTWGTNDGFHFVFQPFKGDGRIVARVVSVENTQNHAKAGLMFRESLAADARHAEAVVTPVDGAQFLARTVAGDKTTSAKTGLNKGVLPYWLKLERAGDKFSGYESTDGQSWTLIGSTNLALKAEVLVGLRASSHQKSVLGTAVFDQVTVSPR